MIHEILENGFEVVLRTNPISPTVAIQVWVKVGSLDELPTQRGMAHFLEHMLFKGTARRGVGEIAATVELCGGDINAYTTFDHTVYHLTLAAPHASIGIDLLADAFGSSSVDPAEFEREKEVILEEIRRSLDSPGGKVGRQVFEMAFAETEAGRPIIGSQASVSSFTPDALRAFYESWYVPGNATLVVVGDVDPAAVMAQVRQTFGLLPSKPTPPKRPDGDVRGPLLSARDQAEKGPRVSILRGDYELPRLEVTFPAPSLAHFDSAALDLAAFALGSGEMSRFNRRLRDREGVVNSVGASVYSPMFGGLFEISAFLTEDQILAGVQGIAREVMLLQGKDLITEEELGRARINLKAERVFRDETVDGQARSLGYGMLTPYKLLYDEVYTSVVAAMPETAVTGALQRWIRHPEAILVLLVPERSTLQESDVQGAFSAGLAEAQAALQQGTVVSTRSPQREPQPHASVVDIKPGLKLVYRHNPQGQIFSLTAATEGGLRGETAKTAGFFNAVAGLLGVASGRHSYMDMLQASEGRGATLGGFSGKDSVGFHLQCLPEDMASVVGLWRECLVEPRFPAEQWDTLQREIEQAIASQSDSPSTICMRQFQEKIYGEHPYRYPLIGLADSLKSFDSQGLLARYTAFQAAGPWVVAATGPAPLEEVMHCLQDVFSSLSAVPAKRAFASDALIKASQAASLFLPKDRAQTHIVYGFPGLTWADPDRAALDVLVNILGGHGGRLFRTLRDKESLAYSVSPIIAYGCHPGAVGSYIACAPGKKDKALRALQHEMLALREDAPSREELERAKNHLIGTHDMGLQRSDAQTSTMALMELYGCGFDDFERYPRAVAKVEALDLVKVARRLFVPELAVDVTVGPE